MPWNVEFQIVHKSGSNIKRVLTLCLGNTYRDETDIDYDEHSLDSMVLIRYSKQQSDELRITGFTIEFDDVGKDLTSLIESFTEILQQEEAIVHILKFSDPSIQKSHLEYAQEIYDIEMKLREVLSFIFIEVYGQSFYNLLQDVDVKIATKELPNEDYFKKHFENEFFFLLFSDYIRLNERKPIKNDDLLTLIRQVADFDALKTKLSSPPVSEGKYHDFLASIKERVDAIDKLRNCVAHNRSIPDKVRENYNMSKRLLLEGIADFWYELNHEDDRPVWEEEATEALEAALENASWNPDDGSVEIYNSYDETYRTCRSYDELVEELERLAIDTSCLSMPYEEGAPVFNYDPTDDVSDAIAGYEKKMRELGWDI